MNPSSCALNCIQSYLNNDTVNSNSQYTNVILIRTNEVEGAQIGKNRGTKCPHP